MDHGPGKERRHRTRTPQLGARSISGPPSGSQAAGGWHCSELMSVPSPQRTGGKVRKGGDWRWNSPNPAAASNEGSPTRTLPRARRRDTSKRLNTCGGWVYGTDGNRRLTGPQPGPVFSGSGEKPVTAGPLPRWKRRGPGPWSVRPSRTVTGNQADRGRRSPIRGESTFTVPAQWRSPSRNNHTL